MINVLAEKKTKQGRVWLTVDDRACFMLHVKLPDQDSDHIELNPKFLKAWMSLLDYNTPDDQG